METVWIIIGLVAAAWLVFAWFKGLPPFKSKVIGVVKPTGDIAKELARLHIPVPALTQATVTPKGVRVLSDVGIPPSALDTIDAGLDELFRWYKSAYPAWTKAFNHAEYAVIFVNPMATNQDGSPAIMVQWQQSAGTCIGFPFPMAYLVLPHQAKQGWAFKDYLFNSVFNEGEHFIESHNSREVFNRFTGLNDVHPHIPSPGNLMVSFRSAMKVPSNCGVQKV